MQNIDIEPKIINNRIDRFTHLFVINLMALVIFGLIMVYSASYIYAKETYGSSIYFVGRQLLFIIMGIALALILGKTRFTFWLKYGHVPHTIAILLLILTFIPSVGASAKGATRWLDLGYFNLQPGELVKYTTLIFSLSFFETFFEQDNQEKIRSIILLVLPLVLLIAQPDYGSFLICFFVIGLVCFFSSFPRKYFYSFFFGGLVIGLALLFTKAYRVQRLFSFLDPWKNPKTSGFQIIQSYLAFANGGVVGQGIGNSNEKLFYLPEAHNDFIFSVVGEELGLIGVLLTIVAFLSLVYFGLRLAIIAGNRIVMIAISAIILTIGFQTLLNMGVVLGLLPTKGLNLPFISYGGSSMIANFLAIGLILSAIRHAKDHPENRK